MFCSISQSQDSPGRMVGYFEGDGKTISFKMADGQLCEVEEPVAKEFKTVRSFFDESDDTAKETVVPLLPNVSAAQLSSIVEYCKAHLEFRQKATAKKKVEKFDEEFVEEKSNEELKELIVVANYLNIEEMLDFLAEVMANRLKNKSVEYFRAFYEIENDYTPEEEAALRKEYEWEFEGIDED